MAQLSSTAKFQNENYAMRYRGTSTGQIGTTANLFAKERKDPKPKDVVSYVRKGDCLVETITSKPAPIFCDATRLKAVGLRQSKRLTPTRVLKVGKLEYYGVDSNGQPNWGYPTVGASIGPKVSIANKVSDTKLGDLSAHNRKMFGLDTNKNLVKVKTPRVKAVKIAKTEKSSEVLKTAKATNPVLSYTTKRMERELNDVALKFRLKAIKLEMAMERFHKLVDPFINKSAEKFAVICELLGRALQSCNIPASQF